MPRKANKSPAELAAEYERHKERARERQRNLTIKGQDIGPLPPVVNSARKQAAWHSFRVFCEQYFPAKFSLAWSDDHLRVIAAMEHAVLRGGLQAVAMPRGSGKTTLCECAVEWALFTGRKRFVFLIGSSETHADLTLTNIKADCEHNDLLLEDWPEICFPIRKLEGKAKLALGQTHCGRHTNIEWGAKELGLPYIAGSPAGGSLVKVAGITGNIRGANRTLESGEKIRPDLVILDDPQTDESARSPSQNNHREGLINGAVLGLAGPDKQISAVMPCTVVCEGDMVDRILDRTKNPEWKGERTKMVYRWPDRQDLWNKYAELRAESLRGGGCGEEATRFYAANREAMDQGAEVAWPARHRPDEISGLQCAINLKLRNPETFEAEYQQSPKMSEDQGGKLKPEQVAKKTNGLAAGDVPDAATWITSMVDVHLNLLYYTVAAWGPDFTGWIIRYGVWPEQDMRGFRMHEARRTLADAAGPGYSSEASILEGCQTLMAWLNEQTWQTASGQAMRLSQGMIDANWGEATDLVYEAVKKSGKGRWLPSHGKGVTASGIPIDAAKPKAGERVGHGWRIPPAAESPRRQPHVTYDTNLWKSFIAARWLSQQGCPGCLTIYGSSERDHKTFAEHCTAEYPVETFGRGRRVDEWKMPPAKPDNHWGDTVVGAAVAASIAGARLLDMVAPHANQRKRVSFHERKNGAA